MGFRSREIWVSALGRYGFQHWGDMGFAVWEIWVSRQRKVYLWNVKGISQGCKRYILGIGVVYGGWRCVNHRKKRGLL